MKKILALLGVISVLALSGCGKVDSAATIGDITISQASAQATVDEVLAERSKVDTAGMQIQTGNALNRAQLRFTSSQLSLMRLQRNSSLRFLLLKLSRQKLI